MRRVLNLLKDKEPNPSKKRGIVDPTFGDGTVKGCRQRGVGVGSE
jgi:hypothetical protein